MTKTLSGMFAALMTGMDDRGEFSPDRQRGLTRYVQSQGLTGLYVGGSSGESAVLDRDTLAEQQAVVSDIARETRQTLIAHVGVPALADSIALARNAERLGYDALSALPPHGYPYSDDEIFGYYAALAAATELPLIVYEIPLRTGRPLPIELLERILDLPNVAGIKFTSTDLFKLSLLRRHRPEKVYYYGFDEIFAGAAALGVDGGIGTTYNLFGRLYAAIWQAFQDKNIARAQELQSLSQEFVELLLATGVLPGMKVALRIAVGIDCGPVRAPMAPKSDDPAALLSPFLRRPDVTPWLGKA